jgi:hypothetical protein
VYIEHTPVTQALHYSILFPTISSKQAVHGGIVSRASIGRGFRHNEIVCTLAQPHPCTEDRAHYPPTANYELL